MLNHKNCKVNDNFADIYLSMWQKQYKQFSTQN